MKLNDSQIRKEVEEIVYEISEFYRSRGVCVDFNPKIIIVNKSNYDPFTNSAIYAEITLDFELLFNYYYPIFEEIVRRWSLRGEIEVNNRFIYEVVIRAINAYSQDLNGPEYGIIIYPDFLLSSKKEEIIAHELWHLVERRYGLLSKFPFIIEGTATHAAKIYVREVFKESIPHKADKNIMFQLSYDIPFYVVRHYVGGSENPYKEMLDLNIRRKIQEVLFDEYSIIEKLVETVWREKLPVLYEFITSIYQEGIKDKKLIFSQK